MRPFRWLAFAWLVLALLPGLSCGTLVETLDGSEGVSGQDGGLICASEDPCTCTPCSSSSQCAPGLGLSCVPARRHSANCPDNRFVCSAVQ